MKTNQNKIAIIGVGLIGASLAKDFRQVFPDSLLIGSDQSLTHLEIALQEKIIDIRMSVEEATSIADLIIISIPVNEIPGLVDFCLTKCKDDAIVIDMGSTKSSICESVKNHPNRKNFVAAHPIAGTENSGPLSGLQNLFRDKLLIICEKEKTDPQLLARTESIFGLLGMKIHFSTPKEHDQQLANLSHLSHVLAYCLANTALKLESPEIIQKISGSGFASTVRLANSKAEMWVPIFLENKQALLEAITVLEEELIHFKIMLNNSGSDQLRNYLCSANKISAIIRKKDELILN